MTALILFYIAGFVTLAAAILAITRTNASHALIYVVVALLAIAVIFFLLGSPFAAALQIVVYAGAIVVLFLFVVMMLNLGKSSVDRERALLTRGIWTVPSLLALMLFAVVLFALVSGDHETEAQARMIEPKEVGIALYTKYVLAVELAGVLLLAALVGAYHLGRRYLADRREEEETS
ncbi:MAG: NADH-quinone oxidoreductase subunit J [Gammaproteobacteria bacterium]|nr:NADH-quinone oxidoreductase subunit J [Gammaproteobacteria bacterium]